VDNARVEFKRFGQRVLILGRRSYVMGRFSKKGEFSDVNVKCMVPPYGGLSWYSLCSLLG